MVQEMLNFMGHIENQLFGSVPEIVYMYCYVHCNEKLELEVRRSDLETGGHVD